MKTEHSVVWFSKSGQPVHFEVFEYLTTGWNRVGGIYIMATSRIGQAGIWEPLYIGQTDNFCSRLSNHEKWGPSYHLGARHILAAVVPDVSQRTLLEAELIQQFKPPLNQQLKNSKPLQLHDLLMKRGALQQTSR
jgi:hypothetical protein